MDDVKRQILKNQASIMMAIVGILDHHKIDDLDYAIALANRMEETKDLFAKEVDDE